MPLLQAGLSRRSPVLLEAPFPAFPHRVNRGPPRPVPKGIVVELLFRVRLQHEYRHCLRYPIDHIRNTEDPLPTLLGYLHRPNRPREITTRRHTVPQLEQVVLHILFELLDRHPVGPSRSAIT